jgi:hypothetical protein
MGLSIGIGIGMTKGRGAFSPAAIPGLAAWYDASRETVADGTAIASAADYSGNARPATQGTAGKRPLFKANIQNGRGVYRFDGTDDFLQAIFTLPQPVTILAVIKQRATVGGDNAVIFDGGSDASQELFATIGTADWNMFSGSSLAIGTGGTAAFQRVGLVFDGANSSGRIGSAAPVTGNTGSSTSGGITMGARGGGTQPIPVDVGEVAVYSRALATGEIAQVMAYLKTKWGL